jgi:hypothetical protein
VFTCGGRGTRGGVAVHGCLVPWSGRLFLWVRQLTIFTCLPEILLQVLLFVGIHTPIPSQDTVGNITGKAFWHLDIFTSNKSPPWIAIHTRFENP